MSIADTITVPANAPAKLSVSQWTQYVPQAVRSAFTRAGGIAPWQTIDQAYQAPLSDLRARCPWAFADFRPAPTRFDGSGRAFAWNMFSAAEPGDTDPVIRTWGDLFRALTDKQVNWLLWTLNPTGHSAYAAGKHAVELALSSGAWNERRSDVLRVLAYQAIVAQPQEAARRNIGAYDWQPMDEARELGDLNRALTANFFAGMIEPGEHEQARRKFVGDYALSLGAKPGAPLAVQATVAATLTAETFTARGVAFDEAVEHARTQGASFNAANITGSAIDLAEAPDAPAGAQGIDGAPIDDADAYITATLGTGSIGDSFRKLVRHPLKWFRSIQRQTGKGIREGIGKLLEAVEGVSWLNNYLFKPLQWHATLVVIAELGRALEDGSISAFREQAVAKSFGQGILVAGTIALAIAPVLPAPWNIIVAAIGAVAVAAGTAILKYGQSQEAIREREQQIAELAVVEKKAAAEKAAAQAELDELERAAEQAAAEAQAARDTAPDAPPSIEPSAGRARVYALAAGVTGAAALAWLFVR